MQCKISFKVSDKNLELHKDGLFHIFYIEMALKAYCRSCGLPTGFMDVIFAHTTSIHAILIKINSEKVVVIQGKHRIC